MTIVHQVVPPILASTGTCAESFDLDGIPAGRYHLQWILSVPTTPFSLLLASLNFVVGDGGPP
ncbi:MAG: hypothetical protein KAX84_16490, partial [Burkholderiales bacterium]|nr:hypothetical protein [Burkholderiales bacterium]